MAFLFSFCVRMLNLTTADHQLTPLSHGAASGDRAFDKTRADIRALFGSSLKRRWVCVYFCRLVNSYGKLQLRHLFLTCTARYTGKHPAHRSKSLRTYTKRVNKFTQSAQATASAALEAIKAENVRTTQLQENIQIERIGLSKAVITPARCFCSHTLYPVHPPFTIAG